MFRKLNTEESRIILGRHENHQGNIIPQSAIEKAQLRGHLLNKAGFTPDYAFSSPQPRAISTAIETLIGNCTMVPIETMNDLGDLAFEPTLDKDTLKAEHARIGLPIIEETCVSFELDEKLQSVIFDRAQAGATALLEIARRCKNSLVISHGGARIEISVLALANPEAECRQHLGYPAKMLEPGEMMEVIVDKHTGEVKEVNYLDL